MKNIKNVSARAFIAIAAVLALSPGASQARIVRIQITQTMPAFGGRNFGEIGGYERVIGKAYGEVDPQSPSNSIIQDIALAPKNAKGMVEYSTDIDILRPGQPTSPHSRKPPTAWLRGASCCPTMPSGWYPKRSAAAFEARRELRRSRSTTTGGRSVLRTAHFMLRGHNPPSKSAKPSL